MAPHKHGPGISMAEQKAAVLEAMRKKKEDEERAKRPPTPEKEPEPTPEELGKLMLPLVEVGNYEETLELLNKGADTEMRDDDYRSCLIHASTEGYKDIVLALISKQADIEAKDTEGWTPLMVAVYRNQIDIIKILLENGAKIDAQDYRGKSPLMTAVTCGYDKAVDLLLYRKASVSVEDDQKRIPLIYAIRIKHIKIVTMLLDKQSDINHRDCDNWTPLIWASSIGDVKLVKLLLSRGADVLMEDNNEIDAFTHAENNSHEAVCNILQIKLDELAALEEHVEEEEVEDLTQNELNILLMEKCIENNVLESSILLDRGAEISYSDSDGNNIFLIAAMYGHNDMINMLLNREPPPQEHEHGHHNHQEIPHAERYVPANIESKNRYGDTALIIVIMKGYRDTLELLLDRGAMIECKDNNHWTPLLVATRHQQHDLVEVLINRGANIEACDSVDGNTSFIYTCYKGKPIVKPKILLDEDLKPIPTKNYLDLIQSLLSLGAYPHAVNKRGRSGLLFSAWNDDIELMKLLIETAGLDINHQDSNGDNALIIAAKFGYIELVKYLIENGANINIQSNDGSTALSMATTGNHIQVVEYLISNNADIMVRDSRGINAPMLANMSGKTELGEVFNKSSPTKEVKIAYF